MTKNPENIGSYGCLAGRAASFSNSINHNLTISRAPSLHTGARHENAGIG